jgi:hypothetical protein
MATTRTVAGEATVGLAEETRDYANRVNGAWVNNAHQGAAALQRWTDTVAAFVPALSRDYAVPSPKQFVDTTFDIVSRTLEFQRQIAQELIDGYGPLYSSDGQPAPEKAAQRANEILQQAGEHAEETADRAKQPAGEGSGRSSARSRS